MTYVLFLDAKVGTSVLSKRARKDRASLFPMEEIQEMNGIDHFMLEVSLRLKFLRILSGFFDFFGFWSLAS